MLAPRTRNNKPRFNFMDKLIINKNWTKRVYLDGLNDMDLLKEIEEKKVVVSAGILVYSPKDDSVFLGIDDISAERCHFSGGRRKKETVFNAALRELEEETLGCIEISEDIMKCPCIVLFDFNYKKFCYILFVATPVDADIDKITENFKRRLSERMKEKNKIEISNIVKITSSQFIDMLKDNNEYRLKKLYVSGKENKKEDNVEKHKLYDNFKKILNFRNREDCKRKGGTEIVEIFKYLKK